MGFFSRGINKENELVFKNEVLDCFKKSNLIQLMNMDDLIIIQASAQQLTKYSTDYPFATESIFSFLNVNEEI